MCSPPSKWGWPYGAGVLASHVTTSLVLTASAGVIVGVLFSVLIALSLFELHSRVQQRGRLALDVHGRWLEARAFQHRTLLALQEALASSLVAANRAVLHYDKALLRTGEWASTPLDDSLDVEIDELAVKTAVLVVRIEDAELRSTVEDLRALCAQMTSTDYDEALAAARRIMVRFDDVNQRLGLLIRDTGPLGRA